MNPKVPAIAILVYSMILILIHFGILPDPLSIVEYIKSFDTTVIYLIMFLVILLESIVYLGFYLPGQFIAVLLVVTYAQGFKDILLLTIVSIISVTIGAGINYFLGYYFFPNKDNHSNKISYKKLLLSMIHITTIALFLFDQGSKKTDKKIILITGLLNLPYYLIIIGVTFYFENQIMTLSENPYIIFVILGSWLAYSIYTTKKSVAIGK